MRAGLRYHRDTGQAMEISDFLPSNIAFVKNSRVQVFLGYHRGIGQAMSSFIPNVTCCYPPEDAPDPLGMPELPLPMLTVTRPDGLGPLQQEWLPAGSHSCVVPTTGSCQNGAFMNREARVLRCVTPSWTIFRILPPCFQCAGGCLLPFLEALLRGAYENHQGS